MSYSNELWSRSVLREMDDTRISWASWHYEFSKQTLSLISKWILDLRPNRIRKAGNAFIQMQMFA